MHISDPASLKNLVLPYHQAIVANDYEPIRALFMPGAKVFVTDLNKSDPASEHDIDHLGKMSKNFVHAIDQLTITLEALCFHSVETTLGSFAASYRMEGVFREFKQALTLRFEDDVDFDETGRMSQVKRTVKTRWTTTN